MTLREHMERIDELLAENPEVADFLVVTAGDDEGNSFNLVYYVPDIGHYSEDGEFNQDGEMNAVCLN